MRCYPGSSSGPINCCCGWRIRSYATNGLAVPTRDAAPPAAMAGWSRHPKAVVVVLGTQPGPIVTIVRTMFWQTHPVQRVMKSARSLGIGTALSPENFRAAFRGFLQGLAACALIALLLWSGKDYRPTEAEAAVATYRFNLLAWEAGNVFDKWYHELVALLPWNSLPPREQRISAAEEFFQLGEEEQRLEGELLSIPESSPRAAEIRGRLAEIHDRRGSIRPLVEQTIEREISDILHEEEFSSRIGAILPPVDTVLSHSPALLVTSPRDRIFRLDNTLLRHGVRPDERTALEDVMLHERDLSAIVVNTGGVGTFPTVVSAAGSLHFALNTVAHEWLHNWFFFQPLGQHFWDSPDMTTLNETAATLGGWEIGDQAYESMTGIDYERKPPAPPEERDPNAFDFTAEMRETRQTAENLLAEGRIEEAESYMEERRQELLDRGYRIRKINQAFFAFYGSYATSAASDSPVEGQLRELRAKSDSLGDFLRTVAQFSSYQEFLDYLEE